MKKSQSSPTQLAQASTSDDEGEEEAALTSLHSLSIQLLDLMHTLHTRAASIFAAWAQEGSENNGGGKPIDAATGTLWATCWCPLLQGQSPLAVLTFPLDCIKHFPLRLMFVSIVLYFLAAVAPELHLTFGSALVADYLTTSPIFKGVGGAL